MKSKIFKLFLHHHNFTSLILESLGHQETRSQKETQIFMGLFFGIFCSTIIFLMFYPGEDNSKDLECKVG